MATTQLGNVLHHLRQLVVEESAQGLSDGQLLDHFARRQDPAAFAALMQRHGRLVLGVCRRVLGHEQDAEDAFQATFLVLARHAAAVRKGNAVAGWLHGVAYRTAMKAKRAAARRRAHEKQAPPPRPSATSESSCRELQAALDEEVQRLPDKYRAPFVLCALESKSMADAAGRLGWKPGTVSGRLSRARKLLLERLARRGIALSAALTAAALAAETATAALPERLAGATLAFVLRLGAAGPIPPGVATLARAVSRSLFAAKAKGVAGVLLAGCLIAAGAGALARPEGARPDEGAAPAAVSSARPDRPEAPPARLDRFGDPLPPGALVRLGTVRFLHGRSIGRVRYSPDGKVLVSSDGAARRFWDAATGRELPGRGAERAALLLTVGNKLMAAVADGDGTLLRDVTAGKDLRRLPIKDVVALSTDGNTLAAYGRDRTDGQDRPVLRVHDLKAGKVRQTVPLQPGWRLDALVLSADGTTLILPGTDNRSFEVWDLTTGTQRAPFGPRKDRPLSWAVSADGKTLATVMVEPAMRVYLWDTRTGKELPRLPNQPEPGSGKQVLAVALSPDGRRLATACLDHTVRVWDLAARKEVGQVPGINPRGFHTAFSSEAAFSPDGKRLALASGGRVLVRDVATGQPCHDFPDQGVSGVVAFAPDGKTLATGGDAVRLWDPLTGRLKARLTGQPGESYGLAFSPDGRLLASASRDLSIGLWQVGTGREVRQLGRLEGRPWAMHGLHFLGDGKTVAALNVAERAVQVWDVATGKEVRCLRAPGEEIRDVAFFPDGNTIVTKIRDKQGRDEKGFRLWDLAAGNEIPQHRPFPDDVACMAVSPDGKVLALGRGGVNPTEALYGSVSLWDPAEGREVCRLPARQVGPYQAPDWVQTLAFSPDGRAVAAGYSDGAVRLWEVASGKERARFKGHRGVVLRVAFSPDGSLLASGGGDQLVLVWDLTGRAARGGQAGR
jgi:RNA polymerase sigma factor (sigma-70 family)